MPLEIAPDTGSGHSIRNVCMLFLVDLELSLAGRFPVELPASVVCCIIHVYPKNTCADNVPLKNSSRSDTLAADGLSEHLRLHFHALFSHRRGAKKDALYCILYRAGAMYNPDPRTHKTRACSLLLWTHHNQACRAQDSQPSFIQYIQREIWNPKSMRKQKTKVRSGEIRGLA